SISIGNRSPIGDAGPAQRIDAELQAGGTNRLKIDDLFKVLHIGADVVMLVHQGRLGRLTSGEALDSLETGRQEGIGALFDPLGDLRIGRASLRRVVFDPAVLWWIVGRRNDDPIAPA